MSRNESSLVRAARLILGSEGSRRGNLVDKAANSKLARKATLYVTSTLAFTTLVGIGTLDAKDDQAKKAEEEAKKAEAERIREEQGREDSRRKAVERGARDREDVEIKAEDGKEPPL